MILYEVPVTYLTTHLAKDSVAQRERAAIHQKQKIQNEISVCVQMAKYEKVATKERYRLWSPQLRDYSPSQIRVLSDDIVSGVLTEWVCDKFLFRIIIATYKDLPRHISWSVRDISHLRKIFNDPKSFKLNVDWGRYYSLGHRAVIGCQLHVVNNQDPSDQVRPLI